MSSFVTVRKRGGLLTSNTFPHVQINQTKVTISQGILENIPSFKETNNRFVLGLQYSPKEKALRFVVPEYREEGFVFVRKGNILTTSSVPAALIRLGIHKGRYIQVDNHPEIVVLESIKDKE